MTIGREIAEQLFETCRQGGLSVEALAQLIDEKVSPFIPLDQLESELPVRVQNVIRKLNLRTLGDLARLTKEELLSQLNFGNESLREIELCLAKYGLSLRETPQGIAV